MQLLQKEKIYRNISRLPPCLQQLNRLPKKKETDEKNETKKTEEKNYPKNTKSVESKNYNNNNNMKKMRISVVLHITQLFVQNKKTFLLFTW